MSRRSYADRFLSEAIRLWWDSNGKRMNRFLWLPGRLANERCWSEDQFPMSLAFGAHVSAAGGVDKAFARGDEFKMDAIQIFTKSERQWRAKPLEDDVIERFYQERKRTGINKIVVHGSYLINLASQKDDLRAKSIDAFKEELKCVDRLRSQIVFLGSKVDEIRAMNHDLVDSGPFSLLIEPLNHVIFEWFRAPLPLAFGKNLDCVHFEFIATRKCIVNAARGRHMRSKCKTHRKLVLTPATLIRKPSRKP